MGTTEDSRLIRGRDAVDVVDEGAVSFDEINGFNPSRRGRRGAALSLLVLAVGAVSALSAMRGRSSSQGGILRALRKKCKHGHAYGFCCLQFAA